MHNSDSSKSIHQLISKGKSVYHWIAIYFTDIKTPGAYCIKLLTGENSGYFLPEFFPVLKSMAESC